VSAIAIPHLEGSTSAIAIQQLLKEMLLRNRNTAITIFSEVRNFKSSTLELHFHNFRDIFGCGIGSIHEKIGGKNLVLLFF
jgi:hypothetical protein